MSIPRTHPLRRLFEELISRRFLVCSAPAHPAVAHYVADLLTDFVHVDRLYQIRDARGRRVEDVAEMLIASDPLREARSFVREREVRKHIGDHTLFLAGLFPEWLHRFPRRRGLPLNDFADYVTVGRESYRVVAAFDQFEYAAEASLFRRLADQFELCVFGLHRVKRDLQGLQSGYYRSWEDALGLGASN